MRARLHPPPAPRGVTCGRRIHGFLDPPGWRPGINFCRNTDSRAGPDRRRNSHQPFEACRFRLLPRLLRPPAPLRNPDHRVEPNGPPSFRTRSGKLPGANGGSAESGERRAPPGSDCEESGESPLPAHRQHQQPENPRLAPAFPGPFSTGLQYRGECRKRRRQIPRRSMSQGSAALCGLCLEIGPAIQPSLRAVSVPWQPHSYLPCTCPASC